MKPELVDSPLGFRWRESPSDKPVMAIMHSDVCRESISIQHHIDFTSRGNVNQKAVINVYIYRERDDADVEGLFS